jgi:hypothetical protein
MNDRARNGQRPRSLGTCGGPLPQEHEGRKQYPAASAAKAYLSTKPRTGPRTWHAEAD